jgi:hypothetical protein
MLGRWVLLAANAGLLAWLLYLMGSRTPAPGEHWLAYTLLICLALNCVYLLLGNNRPSNWRNWRIFRLVGLWLDAKETELRQRADRSRQDKWENGMPECPHCYGRTCGGTNATFLDSHFSRQSHGSPGLATWRTRSATSGAQRLT